MNLSKFGIVYWSLIVLACLTFIGTIIALIVCYSLYQGTDPKNWTLDRDDRTMVFGHVECCVITQANCGRRYCDIVMEFPLLSNIVFSNYSSGLSQVSPGVIYQISNQFNCSAMVSNSTINYQKKSLSGSIVNPNTGLSTILGKSITCYTDYSEILSAYPLIPFSNVNEQLNSSGTALAIVSGLLAFIVIGMIIVFFLAYWCNK